MPRCLTRAESDAFAQSAAAALLSRGWGLWAVALRASAEWLGCVGLAVPTFTAHFTPCMEVLWRLKRVAWGHGYASEAASASLSFAFEQLAAPQVVAFTVPANLRSRRVMQRLGMRHDAGGDFAHPRLAPGHPLRRHVLYRLSADAWCGRCA
jgi:RimJ/RimL family protein N-acetyltransferase